MDNKIGIDNDRWLAYFDILGFSNLVKNFYPLYVLEKCEIAIKKVKEYKEYNVNCKYIFFSDTFIFYTDNYSLDSFKHIRGASNIFFETMFLRKIPMRGCLNVGHFYADEENDIFFGRALIDAYESSEGQDWIGFVLSEEARKKTNDYETKGITINNHKWFQEYDVPFKEETKQSNLLACNLQNITSYPEELWIALNHMKYEAFLGLPKDKGDENNDTCSKCKNIFTKYRNTEDYLLSLYPSLKSKHKKRKNQDEFCVARCNLNIKKK